MSATVPNRNDDVPSQVFASDNQNDETTYYNVTDLTSIKVDELKKYIDTKQQNEELKEDYKVCFFMYYYICFVGLSCLMFVCLLDGI